MKVTFCGYDLELMPYTQFTCWAYGNDNTRISFSSYDGGWLCQYQFFKYPTDVHICTRSQGARLEDALAKLRLEIASVMGELSLVEETSKITP